MNQRLLSKPRFANDSWDRSRHKLNMGQARFARYFVFLRVVLAGLFTVASLAACESLKNAIDGDGLSSIKRIRNPAVSGDPCGHADWFEVGRIDGLSGIKIDHSSY
ncbi:MAG: hypothetical protein U1E10_07250, partial [Bdellovibrionales bacterium]|nr:hypothetical protein [Bdellovibrionales bacterium]